MPAIVELTESEDIMDMFMRIVSDPWTYVAIYVLGLVLVGRWMASSFVIDFASEPEMIAKKELDLRIELIVFYLASPFVLLGLGVAFVAACCVYGVIQGIRYTCSRTKLPNQRLIVYLSDMIAPDFREYCKKKRRK